jgi:hydroxymethylglutaryl-CoA lyase
MQRMRKSPWRARSLPCCVRSMTTSINGTKSPSDYDIKIVEVGPRDGLQNEPRPISVEEKVTFIHKLFEAGCSVIEAGAFVSPKWVPQMADSDQVFSNLKYSNDDNDRPYLSCLVPNAKGMEQALQAPLVNEIAIFASASEEFSQHNISCSVEESIKRFQPVIEMAKANDLPVRAYVSTVVGCPYQGPVAPSQVAALVEDLLQMGCYEISLGDTIGVGTPGSIRSMLDEVLVRLAVCFIFGVPGIRIHEPRSQKCSCSYLVVCSW